MAAGERINKRELNSDQITSERKHTHNTSVCVLKGPLVTVTILFQRLV